MMRGCCSHQWEIPRSCFFFRQHLSTSRNSRPKIELVGAAATTATMVVTRQKEATHKREMASFPDSDEPGKRLSVNRLLSDEYFCPVREWDFDLCAQLVQHDLVVSSSTDVHGNGLFTTVPFLVDQHIITLGPANLQASDVMERLCPV